MDGVVDGLMGRQINGCASNEKRRLIVCGFTGGRGGEAEKQRGRGLQTSPPCRLLLAWLTAAGRVGEVAENLEKQSLPTDLVKGHHLLDPTVY